MGLLPDRDLHDLDRRGDHDLGGGSDRLSDAASELPHAFLEAAGVFGQVVGRQSLSEQLHEDRIVGELGVVERVSGLDARQVGDDDAVLRDLGRVS